MDFTTIRFSTLEQDQDCKTFYDMMNQSILTVVKSLPMSQQQSALFFLMEYGRIQFGEEFDFFKHYYKPLWSAISDINRLDKLPLDDLATINAITLFLHSIDDHLNDQEIPTTHLMLLIRSQAWTALHQAIDSLKIDNTIAYKKMHSLLGTYYRAITDNSKATDLDNFCYRFRGEMALMTLGSVSASLIAPQISTFSLDIEEALLNFGIAWRIIDDIQDFDEDYNAGTCNSVYYALPEAYQDKWGASEHRNEILATMEQVGIIPKLCGLIVQYLQQAAEHARKAGLELYADDFETMTNPLKKYEKQ